MQKRDKSKTEGQKAQSEFPRVNNFTNDEPIDKLKKMLYGVDMADYTTVRLTKETRQALRYIRAETGESMMKILSRLAKEELKRLGVRVVREDRENYDEQSL